MIFGAAAGVAFFVVLVASVNFFGPLTFVALLFAFAGAAIADLTR
jgi:hypothetical protein